MSELKNQNWKLRVIQTLANKSEEDNNFKNTLKEIFEFKCGSVLRLGKRTDLSFDAILGHCRLLQEIGLVALTPMQATDPFATSFMMTKKGLVLQSLLKELEII